MLQWTFFWVGPTFYHVSNSTVLRCRIFFPLQSVMLKTPRLAINSRIHESFWEGECPILVLGRPGGYGWRHRFPISPQPPHLTRGREGRWKIRLLKTGPCRSARKGSGPRNSKRRHSPFRPIYSRNSGGYQPDSFQL